MKSRFSSVTLAAVSGIILFASTHAFAARPANLANTTWNMQLNGQPATLVIETQGGPGGPGGPNCLPIRGHFEPVEVPVHGWYCPATGRIHLIHSNLNSLVTMRTFSGNVSDVVQPGGASMAGTMTVDNVGFGELGEFPFSATEQ
jgi:hypothetical protein